MKKLMLVEIEMDKIQADLWPDGDIEEGIHTSIMDDFGRQWTVCTVSIIRAKEIFDDLAAQATLLAEWRRKITEVLADLEGGQEFLARDELRALLATAQERTDARDQTLAEWRAVLEQYANEENWEPVYKSGEEKIVWMGEGDYGYALARTALATAKECV